MVGGNHPWYEPKTKDELRKPQYEEAYKVFKEVHWGIYFKWLRGYDARVAHEFTQSITQHQAIFWGLTIVVTIEAIVEVYGLPITMEYYFPNSTKKVADLKPIRKWFLKKGESILMVFGQGTKLSSLLDH